MENERLQSGQSLIEVIIAMMIFAVISGAIVSVTLGSVSGTIRGGEATEAHALAQEGMEAILSIREGGWNTLRYSPAIVTVNGNVWELSSGDFELINNKFTRTITFSDVCRDGNNVVATCPASYIDPHTELATINVSWSPSTGITNSVEQYGLLSNWESRDWIQTNWVGGADQDTWSDVTRYSIGNDIFDETAGQVTLADAERFIWGMQESPTSNHLNAVAMADENNGWIVGNSGTILHFDGTEWTVFSSPTSDHIFDVAVVSANNAWAAGAAGKIYKYDGTSWTEHTDTGNESWISVTVISSSNIWLAGNGGSLAHWDGSVWNEEVSPTNNQINDVVALSATNIWAVTDSNSNEIIHYDGNTWETHTNLPGNEGVNAIFFASATDGWAVGDGGQFMRYNGTTWVDYLDTGTDEWRDGYCISSNDCVAIGDLGLIAYWDGSNWDTNVASPTTNKLENLEFLTPEAGWVVGNGGTIIYLTPGPVGGDYAFLGVIVSSAFDMGSDLPIQIIEWDETLPLNTDIQFQIRAAPDSSGAPGTWSDWYGATGVDTYFTDGVGSLIDSTLNGNQWVQYRVELSGDGEDTPILEEVRVNYK